MKTICTLVRTIRTDSVVEYVTRKLFSTLEDAQYYMKMEYNDELAYIKEVDAENVDSKLSNKTAYIKHYTMDMRVEKTCWTIRTY